MGEVGKVSADDRAAGHTVTKSFCLFCVSRIGLATIVASISGIALVYFFLNRDLTASYSEAVARIGSADQAVISAIIYSALFQAVVALSVIAVIVIYYSNLVLGPLYRLTISFTEVDNGEIRKETRIREKDELQSMPNIINDMKKELFTLVGGCRVKSDELSELIEKIEKSEGSEKNELTAKFKEEVALLSRITEFVKTEK